MARKKSKAGCSKAWGSPKRHNFENPLGCALSILDPRPNLPLEYIQRSQMRRITRA